MSVRIPTDCPRCGKVLYPISATRPEPKLSLMGKLGFLFAGLATTGVYLSIIALVRAQVFVPIKILAPIALVPALVVGIVIGLAVNRLPWVVKLRCSKCHWGETLPVPRVYKPKLTAKKPVPTMAEVGSERVMPQPSLQQAVASPIESMSLDQITDDRGKYAEIRAWIFAEFVSGRTFDEIFAEIIAGGWDKEEAEALVEEGRKATRDRRP